MNEKKEEIGVQKYSAEDYGIKKGEAAPGTELLRPQDYSAPRIKLIQPLSNEAKIPENDPAYVKAGNIIHSGTGEILGNPENGFDIIPLRFNFARAMFDSDTGKLLHKSLDGINCFNGLPRTIENDGDENKLCNSCIDSRWTAEKGRKVQPKCPEQFIYPSLLVGREEEGPIAFLLWKMSAPTSKFINTKVMNARITLPFYAFVFNIRSQWKQTTPQRGGFFFVAQQSELLKPEDKRYIIAKGWFDMLTNRTFIVEDESAEAQKGDEIF